MGSLFVGDLRFAFLFVGLFNLLGCPAIGPEIVNENERSEVLQDVRESDSPPLEIVLVKAHW